MAAILPNYEYDIFISYRHKDNTYDGWVTEFVENLMKELEATFKEDVSIYFDENPHDGLLETHDVENSLATKLKCEILIPIISQTYCDPNSFAWTNEFLGFKKMTEKDQVGLKVTLANGNIASRILPVRINQLDSHDLALLSDELEFLRSIDFVYEAAGVNRPLRAKDDDRKGNANKIYYRDQVNKVANAIKEIISGIRDEINSPKDSEKVDKKQLKKTSTDKRRSNADTIQQSTANQVKQFDSFSKVLTSADNATDISSGAGRNKSWVWPILVLATSIAGIALGWKIQDKPRVIPPLLRLTLSGDSTHIVANGCCGPSIAISQNGASVAYMTRDQNSTILYVQHLDEFYGRAIKGTENGRTPFFSPDGNWLGFVRDRAIMKVDLRGGTPVTISRISALRVRGADWAEDGSILYSPDMEKDAGIYRVSSEGGISTRLTMPDSSIGEVAHVLPRMLPGGRHIIYVSWPNVGDDAAAWIAVFDIEDSTTHRLTQGIQPYYSATGHLVYALADGVIMANTFDIESVKIGANPVRLAEKVMTHRYADTEYAVSSSGSMVYRQGNERNQGMSIIDMDGTGTTINNIYIGSQATAISPRFSSNGSSILYAKLFNASGRNQDIWIYDMDINMDNRITTNGRNNESPVWSHDGKTILFKSSNTRNGIPQLMSIPADLSSPATALSDDYGGIFGLPSRNGEPLPFIRDDDIWWMNEDGSDVQVFRETRFDEMKPAISPSKKWIAYDSNESGTREIYIQPFPAGGPRYRISANGGDGPVWVTDSQLVYHTPIENLVSVQIAMINGKPKVGSTSTIAVSVYNANDNNSQNYDVSPDGKSMVIVSGSRNSKPTLFVEVNRLQQLKNKN